MTGRFYIRPAGEHDNEVLCTLAGAPMGESIVLAMERGADFFAGAAVQNEAIEVNLCCDSASADRVAAMFCIGRRRLFVRGEPAWVRYLSDLRIRPEYRGSRLLRLMNDHVRAREADEPSATMHCVVFSDNEAMRGVIRRRAPAVLRRAKFLWFYEAGTYRTSAVSLTTGARRHRASCTVRRATGEDLPSMSRFLSSEGPRKEFFPVYDITRLEGRFYRNLSLGDYFLAFDGTRLVGITGVWDQRAFKRIRVAGYAGLTGRFRPVLNVVSGSLTGFALPSPGVTLSSISLHTMLIAGNAVEVFSDLIERIHAEYRRAGYDYLLCGLFAHDPLTGALDRFRGRRDVLGQHYEVRTEEPDLAPDPGRAMYLEAARI